MITHCKCWSAVFPYLVGQRLPALWGFMVGDLGLSFIVCSVLMIILAARLGVRSDVAPEKTGSEAHKQRE